MTNPETQHNPESPRKFLEDLSIDELEDIMLQTQRTAIESGLVPDNDDPALYTHQAEELLRLYPGLGDYIIETGLRVREHDDSDGAFSVGFMAGAVIAARAITLAAEAREVPKL